LAEGWHADIVLFDPAEIGAGQATFVSDLPAGSKRLVASSSGVLHVLVNGIETVVNGAATGQTPGTLLRSSRDTTSVSGVAPSR
jgi:N-acyl-D-aspartate/D-glutamate deacylase